MVELFSYYQMLISVIKCNFRQSMYVGFRATLNFWKPKIHFNPFYYLTQTEVLLTLISLKRSWLAALGDDWGVEALDEKDS